MTKADFRAPARQSMYQSWGRFPFASHIGIAKSSWADQIGRFDELDHPVLAYGRGRSYGDSCLNDDGYLLDSSRMDHVLAFDCSRGTIRCAAGVTFEKLLEIIVPSGWFLPVTPGTKFVTIAGAVANDVHGKNHHCAGSIGCHVVEIELLRSDGKRMVCSPSLAPQLFAATIGGLGLTGIILAVELQLKPIASPWISVDTIPFEGLQDFLQLTTAFENSGTEYTVAWIDCLSGRHPRGIFYAGSHTDEQRALRHRSATLFPIPMVLPEWVLSRLSVKSFNALYYHAHRHGKARQLTDFDAFFYPLDRVPHWNRIYGARGLAQYQCVVPEQHVAALADTLALISASGAGSFLGVIKRFGKISSPGLISFPRPGLTLALDFPFRGKQTLELFTRLDEVILAAGGALYPAKDGRMSRKMFEASYPRLPEFLPFVDPHLSSGFWRRVRSECPNG